MSGGTMTGSSSAWVIPAGSTSGVEALWPVGRELTAPGHSEVQVVIRAWSLNFRDLGAASGRQFGGLTARDMGRSVEMLASEAKDAVVGVVSRRTIADGIAETRRLSQQESRPS